MFKIKFFVVFAASLLFLNQSWGSLGPSDSSTLADGNASIGCNMQHGINFKDQQEAMDIVDYVFNIPETQNNNVKAKSVD